MTEARFIELIEKLNDYEKVFDMEVISKLMFELYVANTKGNYDFEKIKSLDFVNNEEDYIFKIVACLFNKQYVEIKKTGSIVDKLTKIDDTMKSARDNGFEWRLEYPIYRFNELLYFYEYKDVSIELSIEGLEYIERIGLAAFYDEIRKTISQLKEETKKSIKRINEKQKLHY